MYVVLLSVTQECLDRWLSMALQHDPLISDSRTSDGSFSERDPSLNI